MRRLALASTFFVLSFVKPAPAHAAGEDGEDRYFYRGYDFGSEALYNPVWVIANRGFDVLQLAPHDRDIFHQDFLTNMGNVWDNVRSPFGPIGRRGTWTFVKQEILPLSWTSDTARWTPNYGLHLIGGGQTYAELREWFLAHEATPVTATAFSIATLFTAAFINESIENSGVIGDNTDCLADLYVFDTLGIVLFSFDFTKRILSHYFVLSDWSLQPSFTYPHGDLHNQGNYYSLKWPIPFYPRLKLFGYMGFSSEAGLSYEVAHGYSVSGAAGGKVSHIADSSTVAVVNVVNLKKTAALFLDRHESLLASVHVSDVDDYTVQLNLYPNAFWHTDPGVGMWTVLGRDGRWMAGLSLTHAFGLGVGAGTL